MSTPTERAPEPDPLADDEFAAWRGLLRLHAAVTRELDRRLSEAHGLGIGDYGVLITLVTEPQGLRMTELAERRLVTPSGISRVVDKLVARGWVRRETDPQDRRGFRAVLTAEGVRKLREAQVTHHGVVRERYLGRLERDDVRTLAELFEKALPGIGTAAVWPPRG